ncbi:hypothetical protein SAMN05444354_101800 [Stigmatella aurantiaca]|uniref:Uncharacterized protein n=1 Tax=Stigmatella aurantiaca TaxID=41 RepID=A0A1H7HRT6_STIAU|nr:hypothetical protein [Stigmatella aurantiaca]SEK52969.1 hypothetical protein SAMN05444354_101800 [Stigmatella aurantiaca]
MSQWNEQEPAARTPFAAWEDVRSGAAHFQRRPLPSPQHPLRAFVHGLCLPYHLLRALWADAAARRRYLWVSILQAITVLVLGGLLMDGGTKAVHRSASDKPPASARKAPVKVFIASDSVRIEMDGTASAPEAPEEAEDSEDDDIPGNLAATLETEDLADVTSLEFWAALLAALHLVQWGVIALTRDYHDAIAREASLLTALEPEDGPLTPRVRLNVRWLLKELRHRWRSLVVFVLGTVVLSFLTLPLPGSGLLMAVLVPLWSAYWVVVFTASKSARAWTDTTAGAPWFLRGWTVLTTQVPGFRWKLLQGYGRFWTERTRFAFSPAAEVERQPWAFAGLSVVRALSMLPVLKCFLRPLIPVASAHLLAAHRHTLAAPSPHTPVADPDAPASRPA